MKCSYCWAEILPWMEFCPSCARDSNWKTMSFKRIWRLKFSLISLIILVFCILVIVFWDSKNVIVGIGVLIYVLSKECSKRFHDLNMNWWNTLWMFIPLINLYFLYKLVFIKWTDWDNLYWESPLWKEKKENIMAGVLLIVFMGALIIGTYDKYQENSTKIKEDIASLNETSKELLKETGKNWEPNLENMKSKLKNTSAETELWKEIKMLMVNLYSKINDLDKEYTKKDSEIILTDIGNFTIADYKNLPFLNKEIESRNKQIELNTYLVDEKTKIMDANIEKLSKILGKDFTNVERAKNMKLLLSKENFVYSIKSDYYKSEINLISFLIEKNNSITIENNQLLFDNNEDLSQYNTLEKECNLKLEKYNTELVSYQEYQQKYMEDNVKRIEGVKIN